MENSQITDSLKNEMVRRGVLFATTNSGEEFFIDPITTIYLILKTSESMSELKLLYEKEEITEEQFMEKMFAGFCEHLEEYFKFVNNALSECDEEEKKKKVLEGYTFLSSTLVGVRNNIEWCQRQGKTIEDIIDIFKSVSKVNGLFGYIPVFYDGNLKII